MNKIIIKKSDLTCPICGEENMIGKTDRHSFMWSCQNCPCVIFEHYNKKDLEFLNEVLNDD